MSSFSSTETKNNILCSNDEHLKGSFAQFISGIETYQKIYGIYKENGCNVYGSDPKPVTFTIAGSDTKNNQSININDNCKETREYLISAGNTIQGATTFWETNINNQKQGYIDNKGNLIGKYNELTLTRSKLDKDVQKLLGVDNGIYEKQNILDSAVFTTLLWTVLATSVLFYAFTKI